MNRAAALLFSLLILVATSPADSTEGQGPTRAEVEATMGLPSERDRVRGQMDTSGFPKILGVPNSQCPPPAHELGWRDGNSKFKIQN